MYQPKDIDWLGRWKPVNVWTSTYHITLLGSPPPNHMYLFYIVRLIMFPLWLDGLQLQLSFIFGQLLIVKTDKCLLLLCLCNYYSYNTTVSWLINRKIIEFCITNWVKCKSLSCIQLFGTPWTIQSIEFSRPEYWSG